MYFDIQITQLFQTLVHFFFVICLCAIVLLMWCYLISLFIAVLV